MGDEKMNGDILTLIMAAGGGGIGAWVAVRVDIALAKRAADDAYQSARRAHVRIDEHIERHHTRGAL